MAYSANGKFRNHCASGDTSALYGQLHHANFGLPGKASMDISMTRMNQLV